MLTPAQTTAAASVQLEHVPVPEDQVMAGRPTTGSAVLDTLGGTVTGGAETGGTEIGIWEMTPGAMSDVEADEVFIVLSGAATVDFEDSPEGGGARRSIRLTAGDVVRLTAGMRTVWTVTETLRKLYIA